MKYVAYPDYSRTMDFHNGTTETIWHCGRCMTIKPFQGADCSYCSHKDEQKRESLRKLKELKDA
jgi:hypothetical protein